jgi:hypothetical protein
MANKKHDNESYSEFYARQGKGLTYQQRGSEEAKRPQRAEPFCPVPETLGVRAAAAFSKDIILEGQQQGDHMHGSMGVYELVEGKKVNGRKVWQGAGGWEGFMYYGNKRWNVSNRASMEVGEGGGWLSVHPHHTYMSPDQITEMWQVYDGAAWVDAPKVKSPKLQK